MWRKDVQRALERTGARAPGATAGWTVVAILGILLAATLFGFSPVSGSSEDVVASLPEEDSTPLTTAPSTSLPDTSRAVESTSTTTEPGPDAVAAPDLSVIVPVVPQTLSSPVAPSTAPQRVAPPATAAPAAAPLTTAAPAPTAAPTTAAPVTAPPTTVAPTTSAAAPTTTVSTTTVSTTAMPPSTTLPPETVPPQTVPPETLPPATEPPEDGPPETEPTTTVAPDTTVAGDDEEDTNEGLLDRWCDFFPNSRLCD